MARSGGLGREGEDGQAADGEADALAPEADLGRPIGRGGEGIGGLEELFAVDEEAEVGAADFEPVDVPGGGRVEGFAAELAVLVVAILPGGDVGDAGTGGGGAVLGAREEDAATPDRAAAGGSGDDAEVLIANVGGEVPDADLGFDGVGVTAGLVGAGDPRFG